MQQQEREELFISGEERRKRFVLTILFGLLGPLLIVFSFIDYPDDGLVVSIMDASLALIFIFNLFLIRNPKRMLLALRITILAVFVVMAYVLGNGKAGGHSFVWYYSFPPMVLYLFGVREGMIWVGVSYLITVICFFVLDNFQYDPVYSIRYLATYSVVLAAAYGLESARKRFSDQLNAEKEELKKALNEVKTLHGLLPICANCKKIRNDKGSWQQLELYIRNHSDAEFSHDICPDCARELYGDLLDSEE